jgi:hypothetical protein
MSHHIFCPGKQSRTINLNSHYFIIFQNRGYTSQVQIFARQVYPRNAKYVLYAFDKSIEKQPYGYLCYNVAPKSDQYRLLLQSISKEQFIVLCEYILNVVNGNVQLSESVIAKLQRSKETIRNWSDCRVGRKAKMESFITHQRLLPVLLEGVDRLTEE